MGFKELHSVKEAISLLTRARASIEVENCDIDSSLNRIIAENIVSPTDIPLRDRSVLDGFAVRWSDISLASEGSPVVLRVIKEIPVDSEDPGKIGPGEAAKVSTGSPIPEGANVVVPKEYVEEIGRSIKVYRAFAGGYGISVRGEDLKRGDVVVRKGDIIREWHLAILASLGYKSVKVFKRLRVAVFATGNELVEPGNPKRPGQVYVSTARLVVSWMRNRGLDAEYFGIVPDSNELIEKKFEDLINNGYDIIISTGGTSVGEKDMTVRVLKEIADDYIHGIALSPGKPAAFGFKDRTILMALSGMPVAALSELIAVFDPYYRLMIGRKDPWEPTLKAVMARKYTSHAGFTNVVRSVACNKSSSLLVYPLRVTGSGILSTLLKANSYFIVDEETTGIEEGEEIEIRLLNERVKRCATIEGV